MKLISLNIWGGIVYQPLMKFLEKHSQDIDIFCFQEVLFSSKAEFTSLHKARINVFEEIAKRLPDFTAAIYYAPKEATHFQDELLPKKTFAGQAIFVKKSLKIIDNGGFRAYQGDTPIYSDYGGKITGSCQWIVVKDPKAIETTILNLHGLWQKDTHKSDTTERLTQSKIIRDFLDSKSGKKIICGDFNLKPDGESIKTLEHNMTNLIKKFGITSTRSNLYTKPERFGDYILVSPDVKVNHFEVLQDEISDHLALLLEY